LRDLGHALIDRELYLPQSWTDDADRCREAGIPKETEFASKPRLAQAMISRSLEAGVPFAWFTAYEAYGQAKWLQAWLEERGVSYVMAIRRSDTLTMPAGEQRADALIAGLPPRSWQKISAGARGTRPARVPLGADHGTARLDARPRALAAGPPLAARSRRDLLLHVLRVKRALSAAAANGSNRIALRCPRSTDINALTCSDDLYRPCCH
jgi:DDE superfamily endonuclease